MTTRSKSGIDKSKVFQVTGFLQEPNNLKEALNTPEWKCAMQEELFALSQNQTWTLSTLPPDKQLIGCKWIYKVKKNVDGTLNRYKARLVAKGYTQTPGFNFTETFSAVVKPSTIRVVRSSSFRQERASEISPDLKGTSIFLVGLNSSYKLSLGRILADALRYYYFDIDSLVEEAAGGKSSALSLIERDEEGYLESETKVLKQLSSMGRLVVCAGNGVVKSATNLYVCNILLTAIFIFYAAFDD
ncbi:probable inactive shikimate kinase like 1 chloroplastic [Phtheirospermum japonicum]|uniref:Probable inactive shikimate kinase like 1 chloroplastic n=1 Tax=Phtheirospermum japonicum TaxID=374723 RepID=A0A830BUV0_9LAMI|nr:probable inactive shikimate kinase like 1 chloroplastic [Phtheirospermum japonicum]